MNRPFWLPDLPTIVACSTVALFGMVVLMLLFFPMPVSEAAGNLLNLLTGALISAFTTVISYFFGSSKTSAAKDETIKELSKTP